MDFSPQRSKIALSMNFKLYSPIADVLWPIWTLVMRACNCNYYPHTCSEVEFFEDFQVDTTKYGIVGWDEKVI